MSAINGMGNGMGGAGSVQQVMALRQQILDRSSLLQELQQARETNAAAATAPA
jgi:flagellar hook-basal body complex protein FliE